MEKGREDKAALKKWAGQIIPLVINKTHQTLLSDAHSPITQKFNAWIRKLNGFKTQEDIKEDVEREHYIFVYLCETNYIFYLLAHNLLHLLNKYLNELTDTHKLRIHRLHHMVLPKDPLETAIQFKSVLKSPEQNIYLHQLLEYLHHMAEQQNLQLNLWFHTAHQLRQVEFEHYQAIRDNRQQAYQSLFHVLEQTVSDTNTHEPFYQHLHNMYEQERAQYFDLQTESIKPCINPDGTQNLEAMKQSQDKVVQAYEHLKKTLMTALSAPQYQANEKVQIYLSQVNTKAYQYDRELEIINTKFNALKNILQQRLETLRSNCKEEQKKLIDNLSELIGCTKDNCSDLTKDEQSAFSHFIHQLKTHKENIDSIKTPESLQKIIGLCAHDLNDFIDQIKNNPQLKTTLTQLSDIKKLLMANATKAHLPEAMLEEKMLPKAAPLQPSLIKRAESIATTQVFKAEIHKLSSPSLLDPHLFELLDEAERNFTAAKINPANPIDPEDEDVKIIETLFSKTKKTHIGSDENQYKNIDDLLNKVKSLKLFNPKNMELKDAMKNLDKLQKTFDSIKTTMHINMKS